MPRKIRGGGEGTTGLTVEEQRAETVEMPAVVSPSEEEPDEDRKETLTPPPVGLEIKELGGEAQAIFTADGEVHYELSFASAHGRSDYGGPGSKYADEEDGNTGENQDSMFVGAGKNGALAAGVIDGAGGSGYGKLASEVTNEALLEALAGESGVLEAMVVAHKRIRAEVERRIEEAVARTKGKSAGKAGAMDLVGLLWRQGKSEERKKEGYACAVVVRVEPPGLVTVGWAGDSKVMTVRGGIKLEEGTSRMQNVAAWLVAEGLDKPERYYTSKGTYRLTGMLGSRAWDIEEALKGAGKKEEKKEGEDATATKWNVIPREVPQVRQFQGQNGDQIILASDGLWDVVSEYEAAELAGQHRGRPEELQKALFDLAYARNNARAPYAILHGKDEGGNESKVEMPATIYWGGGRGDNITVQVIELKNLKS